MLIILLSFEFHSNSRSPPPRPYLLKGKRRRRRRRREMRAFWGEETSDFRFLGKAEDGKSHHSIFNPLMIFFSSSGSGSRKSSLLVNCN
jgi:hypothetical protein